MCIQFKSTGDMATSVLAGHIDGAAGPGGAALAPHDRAGADNDRRRS